MTFYRQIRAWWHDAPFTIKDFWQPGHTTYGDGTYKGWDLLTFSEKGASVGDVVGLLSTGDTVHCYEITARRRSSGSDHIVSPYKYDFRYKATITCSEYQEAVEEANSDKRTQLLSLW